MTVTPRLGLALPVHAKLNWDADLNSNFSLIDSSVALNVTAFGSIAAAAAALAGPGVIYAPSGYSETLTTIVTLSHVTLVIDPNASITFGTGGGIIIGTDGVIEGHGATITVTKTSGNAIQINSGWGKVNLGHLIGPASGTGNGLVFDGCSFNTVNIGEVTGFGGVGVLFTCVGVSSITDNNSAFIHHIYANGTGLQFTNKHIITDGEVQNNFVWAGLVNTNTNFEILFGDSGTFGAPAGSAQGNMVWGFADAMGSSHAAVSYLNCSYNYFQGQTNPGSVDPFSFTNSFLNMIVCATATATDLADGPGQIWFTGAGIGTTGRLATIGAVITAGLYGLAAVMGQVKATALGANYNAGSAKTIATPNVSSQFRISFTQAITRAATSSSTMPSLTLGWTDAGGVARTKVLVATSAVNTTAVETDGVVVLHTDGSTPITVTSAGFATSGGTSMQYALSVTAEQL